MKFSDIDQRVLVRNLTLFPTSLIHLLATKLGVTAESLRRLGVGYLPVVEFKHSTNYEGQWTFPMRDATGNIIGVMLRNAENGRKTALIGSKNGVFFAPGTTAKDFLNKWARLKDHGLTCPICGKDDWCLVDAEAIADPAAVICSREESPRMCGEAGWLHILDSARWQSDPQEMVLPADPYPVLVTEGASDTAAAMSLGFTVVGKHNATGGFEYLAKLLLDRDVVIIGDNDQGGVNGATKTKDKLTDIAKTVRMVFPPDGINDMKEWLISGASRESVEEYIEKYAGSMKDVRPKGSLQDDKPKTVASAYCKTFDFYGASTIHYHKGDWYKYSGKAGWEMDIDKESFRIGITGFMMKQTFTKQGKTTTRLEDLDTSTGRVTSVVDNIKANVLVAEAMPTWIDHRRLPDPARTIIFRNGRMGVDEYVQGNIELDDNDPLLFTTNLLPYAFDPAATCPIWDQWLQETLGDDPLKIDLLQEWFGYNLIPDTQYQKMLLIHGTPGSGKSTAVAVLEGMLGINAASASLSDFTGTFGLAHLLGKTACILPDCQLPPHGGKAIVEKLNQMVTGESMKVERKFKDPITIKMVCRITMVVNDIPALPSQNEALQRRIMFLRFEQSFVSNPDTGLSVRLADEMPGITRWALDGLKRLSECGVFTTTATQVSDENIFRNITNPMSEFVSGFIVSRPGCNTHRDAVWECWKGHCAERGHILGGRQLLFNNLKIFFRDMEMITLNESGKAVPCWTNIDIVPGMGPKAVGLRIA